MKKECADRIIAAAGRELTKAELDGIELRMRAAMRHLATTDAERMQTLSPAERQAEATKLAKEWMLKDVVAAHERSIIEAERKAKLLEDVTQFKPGVKGQVQGLKNMIPATENRGRAIAAEYISRIEGLDKADGGKLFGLLADPTKQLDIVKGVFGENTSPEASRAAKSITKVFDSLADHYIGSGLQLRKLESFRLPQALDPKKISALGEEAFVSFQRERMDRRAFVNPDGSQMNDVQFTNFLKEAYATLATDGAIRRAEGESKGIPRLVGGSRNATRELYYKDAAAWFDAMQQFGKTTDLYQMVASHIHGMAKEIALAERFGRNIETNFKQAIDKAYSADVKAAEKNAKGREKLDVLHANTKRLFGAYVYPERVANPRVANLNAQIRGWQASAQLGSLAAIVTDPVNLKMMAQLNNLPQTQLFLNAAKEFGKGYGKSAQDEYRRLGIWFEEFASVQNRLAEENIAKGMGVAAYEITHKLAQFHAFDRGMRAGIGKTFMDVIGDFTRRFETLADAQKGAPYLERYGVDEDVWKVWRKAKLDDSDGHTLLTPESIRDIEGLTEKEKTNAAVKLLEVVYGETQFGARGSSNATAADRVALALDKLEAGTLPGELWRYMLQFKSLPLSLFRQHWERMSELDTPKAKAWYAAQYVGYSTLLGMLAVQIGNLQAGRDPEDMSDPKVMARAVARGGGLGFYGDLLLGTDKSKGLMSLFGPAIGATEDIFKQLAIAREEAGDGEFNNNYGLAGVKWIRQNALPFMRVSYLRAAFDRLVYDRTLEWVSPGSVDKMRRRAESQGASYWIEPGTNDVRAPNFAKAVGQEK